MLFSFLLVSLLTHEPAQASAQPGPATFAEAVQMANDGREAEALTSFQRLVSANPNDHAARLWIARLHERKGHWAQAEAVYRSVLLEDADSVEAMLGVGASLLARDEVDEAIETFEQAERLAPQNDLAPGWLGRAHERAGRQGRAVGYFERAFALAPTEANRLSLESARWVYFHRAETLGFGEQFNDSRPDTRSGELAVNVRLNDALRVFGRGQVQRKLGIREERGGVGVEWKWSSAYALRAHALVGPDAIVMPEGDYLGEIGYTYRLINWTASVRYFDFTGARVQFLSPAVSWPVSERFAMGVLYALSFTETSFPLSEESGNTFHLRGTYALYPRLWLTGRYTSGVDDFETFSIDEIGDFRANALSAGVRFDLPSLTSIVASYEYQWRQQNLNMSRVTVSLAQGF